MAAFQTIARCPDRVGESPVWDVQQRALWWIDIESRCVRRWLSGSGNIASWVFPERIGCIALAEDGRVVAALESRIVVARLEEGGAISLENLALVAHPDGAMRFNDGRCDPAGRLWVGSMVMDMGRALALGAVYCLDERGLTGPYVEGLYTPNGSAFSPDGRTFYLSDSHPLSQQIWAFDFDIADASLSNRRSFVDMRSRPGRPDGAAVDSQGCYWICANDAALVHRFSPAGEWLQSVPVPFPKPAMCCFGGDDGQTLFVTSIIPAGCDQDDHNMSGAVIAVQAGVAGLPEPRFSRFPVVTPLAEG